jgi:2-keto-4-pentenoate hydratase/2-oxohepta-3-ene-1,7-dioic acid hydratase in catechol pathway
MKLAQFKTTATDGGRPGFLMDGSVIDLAALALALKQSGGQTSTWLPEVKDTLDIIRRGDEAIAEIKALVDEARAGRVAIDERLAFALDSVELLPPVYPGKILAIGRNYVDHAIEGGAAPPAAPLIFTKLLNSLSAHKAPIVLPAISSQVDYEAELAVVIGRRAKRVGEADALNHVFGYTLINDVSARDLQFGDGQWVRGKGLDGFAPLGPCITTRDEIGDAHALRIEGRLNGQVMQSSNTGKMIFKVPHLISYISQGITLEPGDVIATGTPEGVGIFRQPPVLLKAGDVFEVIIESLGTLSNPVVGPEYDG